jgi:hypothetical protein
MKISFKKTGIWVALPALFLLAAMVTGCGYYSVSGSLPGHIKRAAVPLFENETVEAGIVEEVTEAVTDAIIRNGSMQVVRESQADAVVSGTIINVRDEADTYSRDEQAKQFRLRVLADVKFFDRVKNKVIFEEKGIEGWARYDASSPAAREAAKSEASAMLANEIIDKIVAGW